MVEFLKRKYVIRILFYIFNLVVIILFVTMSRYI